MTRQFVFHRLLIGILITLSVAVLSCGENTSNQNSNIPFDKQKWTLKTEGKYVHRQDMLADLMTILLKKDKNKAELIELLGKPDRINENHLYYTVSQYKIGLFPLSTKTLVIKLKDDLTIDWVKTHG